MEHVAIDLGGRQSQVCVRAADGKSLRISSRSFKTAADNSAVGESAGSYWPSCCLMSSSSVSITKSSRSRE